ncbi:MAG: cytochrome-c peroxidase [Verrucomicrobia bacterium]|nr:cytochrome-c peroxidase [Verrucomicrobiota bacterium]
MKTMLKLSLAATLLVATGVVCAANPAALEKDNPLKPIPKSPLGIDSNLSELKDPPTPERVRLGRWLYFDKRMSADSTIACATCHHPEHAFSEPTPVSTGIRGQKGARKAPSFINQAWTIYPHFFWDGRAASLEEQALGPVANPIEMGNTHEAMISTLQGIKGYAKYFKEAFGTGEITKDRVAKAIADYERTRLSGNSPWDKWRDGNDSAVSAEVKKGHELFFGKAVCNQCHLGQNFTDSLFHNLGVGWDADAKKFKDAGRVAISKKDEDTGAFKTPTLRDIAKHAPYMHDGSQATLRDTVVHYNKGGTPNPHLSPKIKPLNLTEDEITALVKFMEALNGEGYMDTEPKSFPK